MGTRPLGENELRANAGLTETFLPMDSEPTHASDGVRNGVYGSTQCVAVNFECKSSGHFKPNDHFPDLDSHDGRTVARTIICPIGPYPLLWHKMVELGIPKSAAGQLTYFINDLLGTENCIGHLPAAASWQKPDPGHLPAVEVASTINSWGEASMSIYSNAFLASGGAQTPGLFRQLYWASNNLIATTEGVLAADVDGVVADLQVHDDDTVRVLP